MTEKQNALTWSRHLNDMFRIPKKECTPLAILDTMKALTDLKSSRRRERKALTLDAIVHHARIRNITCTNAEVLTCLRSLYRDGKIRHRCIGDNHRFFVETL